MDNFSIDLCSDSDEHLRMGIRIAFEQNAPGGKATHYAILQDNHEMVLFWHESAMGQKLYAEDTHRSYVRTELKGDVVPLPFPLDANAAYGFVSEWLKVAQFDKNPWHDASDGPGFRLFTDYWGHVYGSHYGIVGIRAERALFGK